MLIMKDFHFGKSFSFVGFLRDIECRYNPIILGINCLTSFICDILGNNDQVSIFLKNCLVRLISCNKTLMEIAAKIPKHHKWYEGSLNRIHSIESTGHPLDGGEGGSLEL